MKILLIITDNEDVRGWEYTRDYFEGFTKNAESKGWCLVHIRDRFSLSDIDCIFIQNYKRFLDDNYCFDIYRKIIKTKIPKILGIFESPTRRPDLWSMTELFDVCISFNKDPGKNCRCAHVECPYPYNFLANPVAYKEWDRRDALVWVVRNNWFYGNDSMSQNRIRDFDYIRRHVSGKSHIYGGGWENKKSRLVGPSKYFGKIQAFNNIRIYNRISKSWVGPIENKKEIISNYKFCFSYENTDNYPGYITEKVFDAWMSGCVPIYRGEHSFEEKYSDILISPRILGKKKCMEMIRGLDANEARKITNKFNNFLDKGEFNDFSHLTFQNKVLDIASSLC